MKTLLLVGALLWAALASDQGENQPESCEKCGCLPGHPTGGTIDWAEKKGQIAIRTGTVACHDGFKLAKKGVDHVMCEKEQWVVPGCLKDGGVPDDPTDPSKLVTFAGITYNYTEIAIPGNSKQYPLSKELAYMFIVRYLASKTTPTVRVHVGLVGKPSAPVLINIQQSSESVGFELPYKVVSSDNRHPLAIDYTSTIRELCQHNEQQEQQERVHILVSGIDNNYTTNNVSFNLHVTYAQDTIIRLNETHSISTSPNNVEWFMFEWPVDKPDIYSAVVSLSSKEHHCELISIQNQTCNAYEESSSINYIGDRLTMTTKASVIVSRHIFPVKFYISVTTAMDDSACGPTVKHYVGDHKTVDFNVHLHHQSNGFLFLPTLLIPICSFLIMFGTLYLKYDDKPKPLPAIELEGNDNLGIDTDPAEMEIEDTNSTRSRTLSYIADDAFMIPDMFRTQVSQFTRHSLIPIIISIAIIPIFTSLIGHHITQYHYYGDLDACYFNIECSFPVGLLPDAGRVVSNVSYVMFGFTLFWLVKVQEKRHYKANANGICGIQHDFELFKAITYSTVLQGMMGFTYHMCPNPAAEAMEKLFFFLALGLITLKIYQSRHPDIKNAVYIPVMTTFVLLFYHSIKNMMDVSNMWTGWIILSLIHVLLTIAWAVQNLFLEKLTLNPWSFYDIYTNFPAIRAELYRKSWIHYFTTWIAVMLNLIMAVSCLLTQPSNFHFYLIPLYLINMLIYLTYYILTKTFTMRERINIFHSISILANIISWSLALYFLYFHTSITTSLSPAQSRAMAKPCVGHQMYDGHDLWHVCSAAGLFSTTVLLLILDDDVLHTPLGNLPYF